MTDRKLLELAAKAACYAINFDEPVNGWYPHGYLETGDVDCWWNPLTDDGDALRLAVAVGINVEFDHDEMNVGTYSVRDINRIFSERADKDPAAAVRRAIVRAAAEIGKGK